MRPGSPARRRLTPALLVMAMVAALLPLGQAATAATNTAVQFDGTNDYVTFGTAAGLGATQFTLELWFRRTGTGANTSTGTGGLATVVPLLTKGRGEAESPANLNMNYFLGIDTKNTATTADDTLAVDFEDTAGGTNHPFSAPTVITSNVWHHAAATYDGTAWRVYLDGSLDGTSPAIGATPESTSIQHAGLGTAMTSAGTAQGFFQGQIDEARVWNSARSGAQVTSNMNAEFGFPTTGLLGRYGFNEATGTAAANSAAATPVGTLTNGPSWVAGASGLDPAAPGPNASLAFNGLSQYVDMGTAAGLNTASWTVETWFKQTNNGTKAGSGTGNGGIANVIPLVSKGRSEAENAAADINYFLGLDVTDPANPKIAADFEESQAGAIPGQNHPVVGSTSVTQNVWHHAAATYDGITLKIYLDGSPEGSVVANQPANAANSAHVALGTSYGSGATFLANGFFGGLLDEARIWDTARTQGQIQASMNTPITSPTAGLLARYGLNEGTGTAVGDSIAPAENGAAQPTANAPSWSAGAPVLDGDVTAPAAPSGLNAISGEGNVALNWEDSGEGDLAGYNVYRGTSSPVSLAGAPLNAGTPLVASQYQDTTGTPGTNYFYVVTAVDTSDNESGASNEVSDSPHPFINAALQLNGSSQYARAANGTDLSASVFSLELWFKKTGTGIGTDSGNGGIIDIVPLIAKGRADVDTDTTRDINYIFGIDQSSGELVADFEEGASGPQPAQNHFIRGGTAVTSNVWHHGAVTYDGQTWRLYLDGQLDGTSNLGAPIPPAAASEAPASLGSALRKDGSASGFFQGDIEEARVWTSVRSLAQIQAAMEQEIPNATGLLARYGMNEGLGTSVGDSSGTPQSLSTQGNPSWAQGYPFQPSTPNDPPVVDSVTINQASPHTNDTLSVTVTSHDPNNDPVNYSYQWSKNNVDISGATGATLNMATAGNGGKGDAIRVRVVANDGLDDSAPVTSSPVTVLNTVPVASVSIDDTTPGSNDVITATATDSDLDGDTVTLTYVWRVNNVVRQTTSNSSSLTDTFDLSLANHGNTSDEVTVTVTPNDGEQNGNAATSATATVQDASSEPNRLPESTWQTNDRVKDILRIGDTVYIAGNFTQIRSNNGAQTMTRNHLAAFDALTGNPLPWNPNANGNVEAITASPDGSIIYAGGVFKKMGGASHQRVAAINAATGTALVWNPFVDAAVKAIATQGTTVYLGGAFVNVNGTPRNRLAAVATGSGNLLNWNPNANNQVRDLVFDSSGARLFAGGPFTNVGSSTQNRIVALDPSSGAPLSFSGARPTVAVITLTADDQGRIFAGSNNSVISYTASTGARNWVVTGDGNIQGLDVEDGTVYAGGHFVTMGTTARNFLAGLDADTGALTAWNATANSVLGVFAVEASADRLYIGGDFTRVSGLDQQGFAMFQVEDNTSPTRPGKPTGVSNTSSSIDLQWAASSDGANPTLTYLVYRDALPNPVGQVVSSSNTTVNFTDNGLTPESVHTYTVVATDGALASSPSDASDQITVMAGADSAPPQLQTIEMRDNDSDGKVDRVVVTFDEALAAYTAGTAPWTLTNVPSAGTLSGVTVAGNQATLAITEGPNAANTAVGTFRVALATNANGIRDVNGNQSSFASVAPADEASPVPINTSRTPGTTSGLLEASGDSFTVTFSEPVNPGTISGTTTISESDPAGAGNDTLQIVGLTNGQINLGANNYVGDDGTTASFTSSTLTLSGGNTVVKATVVGTCSGTGCASLAIGNSAAIAFSPPTSITDVPGNPATGSFTKSFRMF